MTFRLPRKLPTTLPDQPGGRRGDAPEGRQWLGLDVLGILLLAFLALPLLAIGLLKAGEAAGLYQPVGEGPAALIALAVQEAGLLAVTLASVTHGYGRPWRRIGLTRRRLGQDVLLGLVLVAPLYFAQEAALELSLTLFARFLPSGEVARLLAEESAVLSALVSGPRTLALAFAFLLVLLAPLAEEVFFRGFIQEIFRERLGPWRSVVVAALLFAVIHRYAIQFLPVLLVGLSLSALYEWRRSLTAGITAHAVLNLLALLNLLKDLP